MSTVPREAGTNPRGLGFVVDLANLSTAEPDFDADRFRSLLVDHGAPQRILDAADDDLPQIRDATRAVVDVLRSEDVDEAAGRLNGLLELHPARPRLVKLPGRAWSMHLDTPEHFERSEWLCATAAFALGLWLGERGSAAWGSCAAADCERFFVDAGRRTPQRFCSTRCATRVRVAHHRRRIVDEHDP